MSGKVKCAQDENSIPEQSQGTLQHPTEEMMLKLI